jgi:ATP-dependent Clp protease ATP-binding subunit ClpC
MATLHVRNVPEALYERLRRHAEANGRSIGAETVQLLDERLGSAGRRGIRRRRGPAPFERFSPQAREAVESAQDEARALGHAHVGTEHVLLGVLGRRPVAGLEVAAMRAAVGRGDGAPEGHLPYTARAKKALELAVREAHPDAVEPEHVALGLLREGEGLAARLMLAAQPDVKALRRALHDALERAPGEPDDAPFQVVELDGSAADWEAQLNAAAAGGYELVSLVDRRAVLRRAD